MPAETFIIEPWGTVVVTALTGCGYGAMLPPNVPLGEFTVPPSEKAEASNISETENDQLDARPGR